jgi:hypothetical protein
MNKLVLLFIAWAFSFAIQAQQSYYITFPHDGKIVYGTFVTPNGSGPFPAIILNPGSGANDRDGTIPMVGANVACLYPALLNDTLKPYKELAEALVDSGYAVLRYDKLEYTYPTTLGTISFHKLWLPVESAINYVKNRPDVDTNRIILLGHSEGSTLIPFIAKNRSDIKALVSLAGARTPFDSLMSWQLVNIAQSCNGNVALAQSQASQILAYFNIIRSNTWNTATPSLFGVPASAWYDYVQATDPVATNYNLNNLPTLFVGFGLDINVPPAELIRFQNEVTVTNDFWSIPGLIHFMTPNNDPHVSMIVADTIIYWLRQHNFHVGINEQNNNDDIIHIFPNPASDKLTVKINRHKSGKNINIQINNMLGQRVYNSSDVISSGIYSKEIDLQEFPAGVYFLEMNFDGNMCVEKIIKK